MTPALYELIEQRAVRSGLRPATWMRSILHQAATSKPKNDGYIRIREPNGVMS